ncbi:hypothetical protein NLJ89_g10806 [Agrocybe chaxingu]|uniref:Uncharacterized protein n=1 Tax=Agrocybe chaxingu TaxID=84603 RepID=A0A9W8JQJ8_9AGAR|nr:hypothetical protein NLJ89_g10806 [Agrocybe chaxingu]
MSRPGALLSSPCPPENPSRELDQLQLTDSGFADTFGQVNNPVSITLQEQAADIARLEELLVAAQKEDTLHREATEAKFEALRSHLEQLSIKNTASIDTATRLVDLSHELHNRFTQDTEVISRLVRVANTSSSVALKLQNFPYTDVFNRIEQQARTQEVSWASLITRVDDLDLKLRHMNLRILALEAEAETAED